LTTTAVNAHPLGLADVRLLPSLGLCRSQLDKLQAKLAEAAEKEEITSTAEQAIDAALASFADALRRA
jgi:hypothetical protein